MFILRHLRAHVVAYLALVVALSGSAYAVGAPRPGTAHRHVARTQGPPGPQGPRGPRGVRGPRGLTGPRGPAGQGPAYAVFDDDTITVAAGEDDSPAATLSDLPAGSYVISAKAVVSSVNTTARCRLAADDDVDNSAAILQNTALTLPFEVVHTFTDPGTVRLLCDSQGDKDLAVQSAKIVAIRVSSVTNTQVSG